MTPAHLRGEIVRLEQDRTHLNTRCVAYAQALDAALMADPNRYNPATVRVARADLARVAGQLRDVEDRITCLSARLPSAAVVSKAEGECTALRTTAATARVEFEAAADAYSEALDAAERTAQRMMSLQAAAAAAVHRLSDVAITAGLDLVVPDLPGLSRARANVAHLQGIFIGQAAFGDVDDVVLLNLAAAKDAASLERKAAA
jgi:hypothetical protein